MNTHPNLINGRMNDTPLTAKGIEQSRKLGKWLKRHSFEPSAIYTSPAVRTMQTAHYALKEMGNTTTPIIEDALQELDQGEWVGRERSDIYTDEQMVELHRMGKDFKAPGGESMNEVSTRVIDWADSQLGQQCVLAFTHGFAIRCFPSKLFDWSNKETFAVDIPNVSITKLTHSDAGWELDYIAKEIDKVY